MKTYVFSYNNCYRERVYIIVQTAKSRREARARIPFPVTYRGTSCNSRQWWINNGATAF